MKTGGRRRKACGPRLEPCGRSTMTVIQWRNVWGTRPLALGQGGHVPLAGDLPAEQPTKSTSHQSEDRPGARLTIPQLALQQATEVIQ